MGGCNATTSGGPIATDLSKFFGNGARNRDDGGVTTRETAPAGAIGDPLEVREPESGRVFRQRRRVNLGDVSPSGRVRLDALARYLQDVSDIDTVDAGFPPDEGWVVRRSDIRVDAFPVFREWVDLSTWCSGIGGRWAERRVSITGADGGRVEAAVLWVHLDPRGRPARLPERFHDLFAEAARGRTVRARLQHGPLPPAVPAEAYPLRFCDFDVLGHVNNANSWVPVEEARAGRGGLDAPLRASVEHPAAIERDAAVSVAVADADDGFDLWMVDGETVCSTARLRRL